MLWLSRESCHLRHCLPTCVPFLVLASPLEIQLPAKGLGKTARDGPDVWALPPLEEVMELLAVTWFSFSSYCNSHVKSEPVRGRSLHLAVTLSNNLFKKGKSCVVHRGNCCVCDEDCSFLCAASEASA